MYWGETGTVGVASLFDLPLPFVLDLPLRGPGRYLHFLSAWVCLFSGLLYVVWGLYRQHFRKNILPKRANLRLGPIVNVVWNHLRFKRPTDDEANVYNILQQFSYLAVVFVLMPFMFITGLAMSPAITSVFPVLVTMLGGHQSARTLHFLAASSLVIFLLVHVGMVILAGFTKRVRAMITGYSSRAAKELS
jgi:thiosulfate reductase cytochrome b subunit